MLLNTFTIKISTDQLLHVIYNFIYIFYNYIPRLIPNAFRELIANKNVVEQKLKVSTLFTKIVIWLIKRRSELPKNLQGNIMVFIPKLFRLKNFVEIMKSMTLSELPSEFFQKESKEDNYEQNLENMLKLQKSQAVQCSLGDSSLFKSIKKENQQKTEKQNETEEESDEYYSTSEENKEKINVRMRRVKSQSTKKKQHTEQLKKSNQQSTNTLKRSRHQEEEVRFTRVEKDVKFSNITVKKPKIRPAVKLVKDPNVSASLPTETQIKKPLSPVPNFVPPAIQSGLQEQKLSNEPLGLHEQAQQIRAKIDTGYYDSSFQTNQQQTVVENSSLQPYFQHSEVVPPPQDQYSIHQQLEQQQQFMPVQQVHRTQLYPNYVPDHIMQQELQQYVPIHQMLQEQQQYGAVQPQQQYQYSTADVANSRAQFQNISKIEPKSTVDKETIRQIVLEIEREKQQKQDQQQVKQAVQKQWQEVSLNDESIQSYAPSDGETIYISRQQNLKSNTKPKTVDLNNILKEKEKINISAQASPPTVSNVTQTNVNDVFIKTQQEYEMKLPKAPKQIIKHSQQSIELGEKLTDAVMKSRISSKTENKTELESSINVDQKTVNNNAKTEKKSENVEVKTNEKKLNAKELLREKLEQERREQSNYVDISSLIE